MAENTSKTGSEWRFYDRKPNPDGTRTTTWNVPAGNHVLFHRVLTEELLPNELGYGGVVKGDEKYINRADHIDVASGFIVHDTTNNPKGGTSSESYKINVLLGAGRINIGNKTQNGKVVDYSRDTDLLWKKAYSGSVSETLGKDSYHKEQSNDFLAGMYKNAQEKHEDKSGSKVGSGSSFFYGARTGVVSKETDVKGQVTKSSATKVNFLGGLFRRKRETVTGKSFSKEENLKTVWGAYASKETSKIDKNGKKEKTYDHSIFGFFHTHKSDYNEQFEEYGSVSYSFGSMKFGKGEFLTNAKKKIVGVFKKKPAADASQSDNPNAASQSQSAHQPAGFTQQSGQASQQGYAHQPGHAKQQGYAYQPGQADYQGNAQS